MCLCEFLVVGFSFLLWTLGFFFRTVKVLLEIPFIISPWIIILPAIRKVLLGIPFIISLWITILPVIRTEILKNVNSLRGDLPHAPGNMSSISTPGVGQPIPLRRFLPPSWPTSQRRGHLDSHLRDSSSAIAISPNTRWTLWQRYRLFPYLSLSLAYGIQSTFCQR